MAVAVIMPRQGQSVESCIITEWKKNVGDEVQVGDVLFAYETDKSSFEEPAKEAGVLLARFFEADDDVPCLTNVAVIGKAGESVDAFRPEGASGAGAAAPAEAAAPASVVPETAPAAASVAAATAARPEGISPRALHTAERLGVDASAATPTGPHGRVIERDVLLASKDARTGTGLGGRVTEADKAVAPAMQAVEAAITVPASEYEEIKMPNMRKMIAKTMVSSLTEMAQLTHNTSFDATAILAFREKLKAAPESMELPKITINDIILFAASRVLLHHDYLNAHCYGDKMRYYKHVNLGIAVDTPRGLLVPTLFAADTKSLREISTEAKTLIKSAQDGTINPDLLKDGSFTVSNVGMYGIESFTPVINPPQTGLLGVCCITERVRKAENGFATYPAMGLSLTYDHRAVDGAPASRFLKELVTALENFDALLIG